MSYPSRICGAIVYLKYPQAKSIIPSLNEWIDSTKKLWIYCKCHSRQCLCPPRINGCRDWWKVWNALNEPPYFSFLVQQTRAIHQAVEHRCLSITLLVEWPVSFLNLFGLICSLPVMSWKRGLKSFSLPSWQGALTPLCKIDSQKHSTFEYLLLLQHNMKTIMWVTVSWRSK